MAVTMKKTCETKEKLMQVGFDLMWDNSYGSVSVDDICKRAGINKGSFYHFFPSKADLVVVSTRSIGRKSGRGWTVFFRRNRHRWSGCRIVAGRFCVGSGKRPKNMGMFAVVRMRAWVARWRRWMKRSA